MFAQHIERISCLKHGFDGHCFLNAGAEHGTVGASHFKNRNPIVSADIEFAYGASFEQRSAFDGLQAEHEVVDVIIMQQRGQRLVIALFHLVFFLFVQEKAAERIKQQQPYGHTDKTDGEKVEKAKTFASVIAQITIDNQVGRRTDERKYTTHRTGKGQRHHEFARAGSGRLGHGQHNGEQQCHCSCVAHKGSYRSRDEHHQKEKFLFARTGQFQQTSRNDFGQTGLEHSSAHDK